MSKESIYCILCSKGYCASDNNSYSTVMVMITYFVLLIIEKELAIYRLSIERVMVMMITELILILIKFMIAMKVMGIKKVFFIYWGI